MPLTLTARNFAGGVEGGQTYHEDDGEGGLVAYHICGWVGKLRTRGGWNAFRAQSLRDYDKHVATCDVAKRLKPPPDWGTITHEASAENEVTHSHRSWRAKCACGWSGDLYWEDDAKDRANQQAVHHLRTHPEPAKVGWR